MRALTPIRLLSCLLAFMSVTALTGKAASADEIVVAGGCFWCVEADFEKVRGVSEVISGYTGGSTPDATYKQVTSGRTGHFEAVRIVYDGSVIDHRQLYDMFLRSIDPLDAGGQFCDRGDTYRTAIFVKDAAQKTAAEEAVRAAEAALNRKIVTQILPAGPFYKAEAYHQDYYKGKKRVVTRFGVIRQYDAYKRYRKGCGRDKRVKQIWGEAAVFAK